MSEGTAWLGGQALVIVLIQHYNAEKISGAFSISLLVWRLGSGRGRLIGELVVSINVTNPVHFQCAHQELIPSQYINAAEGDILGIRQISTRRTSNAELSAVVNTEERTIFMFLPLSSFLPTEFPLPGEIRSNNAILVSATVEEIPSTEYGPLTSKMIPLPTNMGPGRTQSRMNPSTTQSERKD